MGVRADSFENLRAFQAFQMNLISVGSISLDSSFKRFYFEFIYWSLRYYSIWTQFLRIKVLNVLVFLCQVMLFEVAFFIISTLNMSKNGRSVYWHHNTS